MRRSVSRWIVFTVSGFAIILLVAAFILNFVWAASLWRFSPNQVTEALVFRGGVMFSVTPVTFPFPPRMMGTWFSLLPRTPQLEDGLFGFVEWRPYGRMDANGWALNLPFWLIGLPFVGTAYLGWRRTIPDFPKCRRCKYSIDGLQASICPECGSPINNPPACASSTSPPA